MLTAAEAALDRTHRIGFLIHLARNGGTAQPPALRLAIGVEHRGSVSHAAKHLAAAGLIRIEDASVALTPRGRRALRDLAESIEQALAAEAMEAAATS